MTKEHENSDRTFVLTVHPSVVFKLGEDLITDDVQALTELVKNSYDADSTAVEVRISTTWWSDYRSGQQLSPEEANKINQRRDEINSSIATERDAEFPDPDKVRNFEVEIQKLPVPIRGRIEVKDRGTGMTLADIERGWLTVSASTKRAMKKEGKRTLVFDRTPLGDKGLGRLGAQRLGKVLDMRTRTADSEETIYTSIYWDDFQQVEALSSVPISVISQKDDSQPGTAIVIRGLNSISQWSTDNNDLQRELAEMISPYSDELGFKIALWIDGRRVNLRQLGDAVLRSTAGTYMLKYSEGILNVKGGLGISYLRADRGQDKIAIWNELIAPDNGHKFLSWLMENEPKKATSLGISHGDDQRFCTFETQISLDAEAKAEYLDGQDSDRQILADPGPFEGRVDLIQRRLTGESDVFDSRAEFRDWMRTVSGVRLYRNGFGIRLRKDWLDLASQWTNAKSYYTIRPENVIGYINLTADGNAALEETSNREDIRDTAAYRNFQRLFATWLTTTEAIQAFLRRNYTKYVEIWLNDHEGLPVNPSPRMLANELTKQFDAVAEVSRTVNDAENSVTRAKDAVRGLRDNRVALTDSLFVDEKTMNSNDKAVDRISDAIERMERELRKISEVSSQLQDRRGIVNILMGRLEEAEQQVTEVWDLVSLGITAESVAHEVLNVTDRIVSRSTQIGSYNTQTLKDQRVGEYIEHVKASSRSLAKQVSHLDASLRYMRDKREVVTISSALSTSVEYFNSRWTNSPLRCEIVVEKDFQATISPGKFAQVVDNLLLNSEYWMREDFKKGNIESGIVTIVVAAPCVIVFDNGPGVDRGVEELVFDPFVTRKPGRNGRGLGLFVVRQLLDSEGANISLDVSRNSKGNRFRFRIDLEPQLTV